VGPCHFADDDEVRGYALAFATTAISFFTVFEGCAPLLIHALALSRSIFTVGGCVTGL